nr:hypothetical protein [Tanacetum cinerariifolium]
VKENQEKDKIGSKPDKNGKRVEAKKSLMQLQWEEEPGKPNVESEIQAMVLVFIYQDTSSVPPMTTPVSKAVNEIVTDAVEWAMQAPLRACFSDLPAVDMREILQQRMFKDKSYEAHEDHKKLYDALEKSLERDYSDQLLLDLEEARQKKRKRCDVPRTPSGSPPPHPPPPPPPEGASGAPCTSGASGSSQLALPLSPLFTGTSGSAQQQGSKAPSSSKSAASAPQSMAWTTSDTRYELAGVSGTQELSPTDSLIQDDSIPNEHVHLSDDEDSGNDHLPKAYSRKDYGNHYLKRKDKQLLNLLGPFLLPMYRMLRTTGLLRWYDYLSEIFLRRADLQEHTIAEKDFKNLYPSDFEDLNLLLLQGYEFKHDYTIIESPRPVVFPVNNNERKIMRFNEIYKFNDGTLTRILEALAYRVKEFSIKRLNLVGFNPLVYSFCALSTLRRSRLRTDNAATKPCQGDSLEVYLITGRILMVAAAGQKSKSVSIRSEGYNITWRQYFTARMIKRFTMADYLKESSKITQVEGTMLKDHYINVQDIT